MKGNNGSCHVLLSTDDTVQVNIGTARINNSNYTKVLGVKSDCKLSFDDHIENTCKKAGKKLNALTRVAQYMNTENAFLSSQFNYYPVICMFHNSSSDHKIYRFHERCFRVIYNDGHSSFDELLNLDNFVSIHHKKLQILAT